MPYTRKGFSHTRLILFLGKTPAKVSLQCDHTLGNLCTKMYVGRNCSVQTKSEAKIFSRMQLTHKNITQQIIVYDKVILNEYFLDYGSKQRNSDGNNCKLC